MRTKFKPGLCLVWMLASATTAAAISSADRCEADKLKAVAKLTYCRQMADVRAVRLGLSADYAKCEKDFAGRWLQAEARGGSTCPTLGDAPQVRAAVTSRTSGMTATLDGASLPACGVASFADAEFLVVVAQASPGLHPNENRPILRYLLSDTGNMTPIPPIPADTLAGARTVAFDAKGELFVGNRHGSSFGRGGISRFVFDAVGYPIANGEIAVDGISDVEDLTFCPNGELFAVDASIPAIRRFTFSVAGEVLANGIIDIPANGKLACSSQGELFFAPAGGPVLRFLIDPVTGAVSANGWIAVGDVPNHLAFGPSGELFVSDGDTVHRVLFDLAGEATPNGSITVHGADGIAVTSAGELLVSGHTAGGILRFVVDPAPAQPNGQVETAAQLGGVAVYRLATTP